MYRERVRESLVWIEAERIKRNFDEAEFEKNCNFLSFNLSLAPGLFLFWKQKQAAAKEPRKKKKEKEIRFSYRIIKFIVLLLFSNHYLVFSFSFFIFIYCIVIFLDFKIWTWIWKNLVKLCDIIYNGMHRLGKWWQGQWIDWELYNF